MNTQFTDAAVGSILVVDDQPANLRLVAEVLKSSGNYRVYFALDGEEALRQVEKVKPELILMDVMMPGISGYEACERLKQNPHHAHIPVLFLTALNSEEDMVKGFRVGGADYITKPFEISVLMARVETHLQNYRFLQKERAYSEILEQEVATRTEELVLANQAKDDFLATMSHELRTPLASVIGNAEYLLEIGVTDEQKELVKIIESSAKSQLNLINDILDMSKIQSGKFSIDKHPYDLVKVIDKVENMLSVRARDSGLQLIVEQCQQKEVKLLGDAGRISQILINLLSNAIKFTPSGYVKLTCWSEGDKLYFQVIDTGIGISEEALGRLFSSFEQADQSISRRFGGTGLGLYISRNLANLMGGKLEASSTEGEGSEFLLTLPYQESQECALSHDDEDCVEGSKYFSGRVLIAEDTPELQILERRVLEHHGLEVVLAVDGVEAVNAAMQEDFDLIFMDMQMPHMDGIEATKILTERGCRTPIVALTANVMQKHRSAFSEAGCQGFLSKPIERPELLALLNTYLTPVEAKVPVEAQILSGFDKDSHALEEVDDELMQFYLEAVLNYIEELKLALQAEDWVDIKEIAHRVKGTGSSFGYPKLSARAQSVCDAFDYGEYEKLPLLVREFIDELVLVQQLDGE